MKNLIKIIGILLTVSACVSSRQPEDYLCPKVQIPRGTAYVTQIAGYSEEVRIEIVGFEGYCVTANTVNRRYAVIKPIFKVQRLTKGTDTRVDFSYFTQTIKGPPAYVGRRSYSASVEIPHDMVEKQFSGVEVRVRLPFKGYDDFTTLLGMNASAFERDFNQKSFDVDYRYLTPEELREYNQPIVPRVVEVDDAPDIQYIPLKPLPVKEKNPIKTCGSCSL